MLDSQKPGRQGRRDGFGSRGSESLRDEASGLHLQGEDGATRRALAGVRSIYLALCDLIHGTLDEHCHLPFEYHCKPSMASKSFFFFFNIVNTQYYHANSFVRRADLSKNLPLGGPSP